MVYSTRIEVSTFEKWLIACTSVRERGISRGVSENKASQGGQGSWEGQLRLKITTLGYYGYHAEGTICVEEGKEYVVGIVS